VEAGAAMRRRALNPEDRKVFDSWAKAVAAFYSLVVVGLLAALLFSPRAALVEKASFSAGDMAVGSGPSREHHP
jgi:hypothetical protein